MEDRGLKIIKIVLTLLFGIKNAIELHFKFTSHRRITYKKQSCNLRRHQPKKQDYKKRNKLAGQFFDFNQPCPPMIKNCMELRVQYENEVKKLESYKLCTQCSILFLRQNIIASFEVD
jgi:hypothetical protein